jgi:L-amino acid N-acyltransferase YncA
MKIREATKQDIPSIASVHVASWQSTYRGIVSDTFLDSLKTEQFIQRWESIFKKNPLVLVAENDENKVVGFISGGPSRFPEHPFEAELYAVYLLKDVQRQGTGKKLLLELVRRLVSRGYRSMLVWVLKKNPARKFYEKMGGTPVTENLIDIGGQKHPEMAYGWHSLQDISG